MYFVPKAVFFVKGKGYHASKLASLEHAMREAGIEKFNLVKVTSILPPNCIEVTKDEGLRELQAGQVVFTVMSHISSNETNRMISASIGVAKPTDKRLYGYLSEHHAFGMKPEEVGEFAEDLAAEMLATTLGIPFDVDDDYDEKKDIFKMNGKIVETKNITESGIVKQKDKWMTVLAAAVFII